MNSSITLFCKVTMGNVSASESSLSDESGSDTDPLDSGVEYSAEFQEIDAAINTFDAEGWGPLRKGERPFQWDSVARAAEGLLAQSPDLRVALWLLRALLEQQGVVGFVQGLMRIGELLALPPASLFPRATDGEPARAAHAVSLAWLGGAAVLHQLRNARLAADSPLACADLHQDVAVTQTLEPTARLALAAAMQRGLQALDAITEALQQDGAELSFSLVPLHDEIEFLDRALGRKEASPDAPDAGPVRPGTAAQDFSRAPGLRNRTEVQQTLVGLIAYFREQEPGHPAPLLLQRVQRMLGASFEELMSELYADATQMIARIEKPQTL